MIGKTREERKLTALLRAQLSLRQACERIDYLEDVIKPQVLEMRALAETNHVTLEIEEGDLVAPAD